ncbi:Lrp/AsnC family transcriptional regulator [Halomicrobium urmianum]|uniref:Lrp/AsnC family transcriptional regulator n=1 Tax=Halomicrobium urmianum TaxID=1586233 RepID=UPI001CDA3AE6|nr:Lrp/AsnC family transcriptional regulator [Halomicrobium urmianum]
MADYDLDDVDRQILDHLQEDARYTATELAEAVGVSDNTIHNRMERLEEAGVITGYTATVDHDRAGLSLYFHFTCTARISDRADVAEEVLSIPEVIEVTELMTGQRNLHVRMVAADDEDITRLAQRLDDLALEINDENLIREERRDPLAFVEVGEMLDRKE